jgi:sigma-B regulation protein RsbU (phosphoserine phosphatase)
MRPDDDTELRRLRDENHALRSAATASEAMVRALRDEAGVRDDALEAVRRRLLLAESELDDLRNIRDLLVPATPPERPGLDIQVAFDAATDGLSGDFYLVAEGPDPASTVVVVGDVAGKGHQAAREAAFVRAAFATTAPFSDDPCRLLDWANLALGERADSAGHLVTAACLTYREDTRALRWAYAGHPPALQLRTGAELRAKHPCAALGVLPALTCGESRTTLAPGDGVLLYTDGLTEARTRDRGLPPAERFYGLDRASAAIRALAGAPAADVLARLRADAVAFGDGPLADDLCLVALTAA